MAETDDTSDLVTELDFAAMSRSLDAIEDPGGDTWQNNGYPENLGIAMTDGELARQARREGYVPPEDRGDVPQQGPDTLPEYAEQHVEAQADAYQSQVEADEANSGWDDFTPAPDTDPVEEHAQARIDEMMAKQAHVEMPDGSMEPPIVDSENDEASGDGLDAAVAPEADDDASINGSSSWDKNLDEGAGQDKADNNSAAEKAKEQTGQQPMMQAPGAVATLIGAGAAGTSALLRGASAPLRASAYGAKWGWNANQRQRSRARRSQVERTLARASTVNDKFSRGLGKLDGTHYQQLASQRAKLMNTPNPTEGQLNSIDSLGHEMQIEASSNPAIREGLRDIKSATRDAGQVTRQMASHVRRGTISEDEAIGKIESMRGPLEDNVNDAKGMVDNKGEDVGEKARRMMERFKEMFARIAELFGLRRQGPEQAPGASEMAAG